jgi:hypothetical protein
MLALFLLKSFYTLIDALKDDSSWLRIVLAGGGFIIFLGLFSAAVWTLFKLKFRL